MIDTNRRYAWRLLARALVLATVAGAVLCVAVAWTCTVVINVKTGTVLTGSSTAGGLNETWVVRCWTTTAAERVLSQRFTSKTGAASDAIDALPRWAPYAEPSPAYAAREVPFESREGDARGWPLLSMWSEQLNAYSTAITSAGGIDVGDRTLPLRVIPLGFLVNTALFTAVCFAIASPLVVRQFRRYWQRRCRRCGYPIGVSPRCSECGGELLHQRLAPAPDTPDTL